jgi:hypothetical protein
MIFIVYISLLLLLSINSQNFITLPFKSYLDEKNDNIMKSLFHNNMYLNFTLGTPEQNVPILIKFNYYYFSFNNKNSNSSYFFNEDDSISYKQISNNSKSEYYEFTNGFKSEDRFYMGDKKYQFRFFCSKKNFGHNIFGGTLGLSLQKNFNEKDYNFIQYSVKEKFIDDYSVLLSYSNKTDGKLQIGSYLYKIDKKYKESDFKSDISPTSIYWSWNVKTVKIGKNLNIYTINLIHYPELGVIIGNKFFDNNSELCKKETVTIDDEELRYYPNHDDKTYIYYKCSKDFNIQKLESISLDVNVLGIIFTLDYNDLFYEYNNNYYFLIIFPDSIEENYDEEYNNVILGSPFYKKYDVTFDMNRKLVGIYKTESNKKNSTSFVKIFIVLILIGIILYLLYYAFYVKKISLKRYNLKNILNDDYEYKTTDNIGLK